MNFNNLFKLSIIFNMGIALYISVSVIFSMKLPQNAFILFIILSITNFSIIYLININNQRKERLRNKEKEQNNFDEEDIFKGHKRTERIFNNKEDRTIHNKKEFEEWKKNYYKQYEPTKPKLEKEYITMKISIEEKNEMTKTKLKKQYYKLAQKYHPDNKDTGDNEKMQEINKAYSKLSKRYA